MKTSLIVRRSNLSSRPARENSHRPENRISLIERQIYFIRGQKVMLDVDLAFLYGVETRVLNQAVRRNLERFPADFMFRLEAEEARRMRSQIVIASPVEEPPAAISRKRNLRHLPFAFTEQGIAMLSSVLRSPCAILVNVEIMRSFVRLRQLMASNAGLSQKLAALEKRYDRKFKIVFDAIRELMAEPRPERAVARREIGFHTLAAKPQNGERPRSKFSAS
ncbi:MAG: ORF6N domain-containing protein [Verrucomicrobia bacterium]|nr:ORF6N domain-containing protein [Verrucomicrobiota bacterium]